MELSVDADCGVLGEDCDAMDVILAQELVGEIWDCMKGVSGKEGKASRLKSTPIDAAPS